MREILRLIRQRARFRRLKRDLAHPNLTTAELDELLSDIIDREEAPRHDGPELAEHLRACELAKAAGASVPADIDPETYRWSAGPGTPDAIKLERRVRPRDRRRRVPPPYTLSGQ